MPRPRTLNQGHSESDRLRRIGGRAAVDFVNTVDPDRPAPETLHAYADLVGWCEAAGLIAPAAGRRLRAAARAQPQSAAVALDEALAVREAARGLYAARVAARRGRPQDLAVVNAAIVRLGGPEALEPAGLGYGRATDGAGGELAAPLRALTDEIAAFLVSEDLAGLSLCEGPGCGWFFIDKSPSRRRRWCSMAACGNRDKAHRHYLRTKARG